MREDERVTDPFAAPSSPRRPRRVILLGSTGSIGTQALDLVRRNPDRFEVVGLSAGGNLELLAEQAVAFEVPVVAAANATADELSAAIRRTADGTRPRTHGAGAAKRAQRHTTPNC